MTEQATRSSSNRETTMTSTAAGHTDQASTDQASTDQAGAVVRDVLTQLYAAWAAGDADAFAALYRDDATVVMPTGFYRGSASVRDHMAAGFAGPLRGSRGIDEPQDVRFVGPDIVIAVSSAGILMAGEQELPVERRRLATWVLCRQDGEWLVAAYTNTPAPHAPAPNAPAPTTPAH
jgi:uncharacterized protein (TIGR02246 family)